MRTEKRKVLTKAELISDLKAVGVKRVSGKALDIARRDELLETHTALFVAQAPRHLSHTQVNTYMKCPRQYYYSYILKVKRAPPGASMTLGSVVDKTENYAYTKKMETFDDEPLDVLRDVYHEHFKEAKDDTDWREVSPDETEKNGDNLIRVFREHVAPTTIPIAVQETIEVSFKDRLYTFVGVIDLVAQEGVGGQKGLTVIDNKVMKTAPQQEAVDVDNQLTAYGSLIAHQNKLIEFPTVGLDALVWGRKEPSASRPRSTRTPADVQRWWRTVDSIWHSIAHEDFPPCSPTIGGRVNWVCTPQWCGYYKQCKEEY